MESTYLLSNFCLSPFYRLCIPCKYIYRWSNICSTILLPEITLEYDFDELRRTIGDQTKILHNEVQSIDDRQHQNQLIIAFASMNFIFKQYQNKIKTNNINLCQALKQYNDILSL